MAESSSELSSLSSIERKYNKVIAMALLFICTVIGCVLLKAMSKVFLVITMSVLLSLVFYPLIRTIHRKTRIPWTLVSFLVLLAFLLLIVSVSRIAATSLMAITTRLPHYESKFNSIYQEITRLMNIPFDEEASLWQNMWSQNGIRGFVKDTALSLSSNMLGFVKSLLMILLFAFFLLSEMRAWRDRIQLALSQKLKGRIIIMLLKIMKQVTQYVSIKFLASLSTGILVFLTCLGTGMDFPVVWGMLAFIFNFIPTFGSILSCMIIALFALIQFYPSPAPFLLTSVGATLINIVIGNFIEPKVTGDNIGISPFLILVSLSIWGWIWGFPGMLIAVPMLVIFKIICEHVSFLRPVAVLIGHKKHRK